MKYLPHPNAVLSYREAQVLEMICEEKHSKEIASQLSISYRSVENIRERLYTKTGSRTIAGLALFAVAQGIVVVKGTITKEGIVMVVVQPETTHNSTE